MSKHQSEWPPGHGGLPAGGSGLTGASLIRSRCHKWWLSLSWEEHAFLLRTHLGPIISQQEKKSRISNGFLNRGCSSSMECPVKVPVAIFPEGMPLKFLTNSLNSLSPGSKSPLLHQELRRGAWGYSHSSAGLAWWYHNPLPDMYCPWREQRVRGDAEWLRVLLIARS